MKNNIEEQHHSLLDDAGEKLNLYMAHSIRVKNQCKQINEIIARLKEDEAMIVIDFKMKFESLYFREKNY